MLRDMAIARASFENIPIHLVTSVPSIETYNNIQTKKYKHATYLKKDIIIKLPENKDSSI